MAMNTDIAGRIVDVHAYLDESRIDVAGYVELARRFGLSKIVLSAACTKRHEPDKSPRMYAVQRLLLKSSVLRPLADLVSRSFYDSEGRLRPWWRLFTRGGRELNKVMHPDNVRVEEAIASAPELLRMWYWINPADAIQVATLEAALRNRQIVGIKFHAYWHGFDLKALDPYLSFCTERDIPVYLIMGFGRSGNYGHILRHHPRTKVIFGYGGFPYFSSAWNQIKDSPNKYIDLTSLHLDRHLIGSALRAMGPGRCLYGSDSPYNFCDERGDFDYLKTFQRNAFDFLDQDAYEAIYWKNFHAVAGDRL